MTNQLGIWLNDKEYLCDVNEQTTCDEVIQLLIKPPVNQIAHSFEVNAWEYKLDKLFAKQSDSSNNISNGNMNKNGHISCQSRLEILYDSRIEELSKMLGLLDSTIEIYENTDVEDGLSEDEIVENQITRMGILLKKQSTTIKNLSKQQNTSFYTEKITKETLLAELEENYNRVKMYDYKLQELQSSLDILNWRMNKYEINPEEQTNFRRKPCSPRLTKNKFTNDYYVDDNYTRTEHGANDECQTQRIYTTRTQANEVFDKDINEKPRRDRDIIIGSNEKKEMLTRKEIICLTFGLEDDKSSVLV